MDYIIWWRIIRKNFGKGIGALKQLLQKEN